jgi:hypothetical protein
VCLPVVDLFLLLCNIWAEFISLSAFVVFLGIILGSMNYLFNCKILTILIHYVAFASSTLSTNISQCGSSELIRTLIISEGFYDDPL